MLIIQLKKYLYVKCCPYFNIALVMIRNVDFIQISLLAGGGGAATPVRAPVTETMFEEMARKVLSAGSFVLSAVSLSIHALQEEKRKGGKIKSCITRSRRLKIFFIIFILLIYSKIFLIK